jgi:hypothetical protein
LTPRRLHQIGSEARLIALAVPKCSSSARLRAGPMPGTSSSGFFTNLALALGPVRADGEAMRLVAQALDEIERRIARRQLERRPPRR